MVEEDDDTKVVNSRVSGYSRGELEASISKLGFCIARKRSASVHECVQKALLAVSADL